MNAVTTNERVKILDFGLARAAGEKSGLTQHGTIVGTPAYMAPEQVEGRHIDPRCDLFSLGCVLYRASTGEVPFKGNDTVSTLMAVATAKPKPPCEVEPSVPLALSDFILKLLAKNPAERPVSAREVVQTLESTLTEGAIANEDPTSQARSASEGPSDPRLRYGLVMPAPTAVTLSHPHPRSRWLKWSALAAGILLGLGVLAYFLVPSVKEFAQTVIRIATNKGELVIETEDEDIEVTIRQPGEEPQVVVVMKGSQKRLDLRAINGEIEAREHPSGLRFRTRELIIGRGERIGLKASMLLAEKPPPERGDPAFQPLFNGKDLDGWEGDLDNWRWDMDTLRAAGPKAYMPERRLWTRQSPGTRLSIPVQQQGPGWVESLPRSKGRCQSKRPLASQEWPSLVQRPSQRLPHFAEGIRQLRSHPEVALWNRSSPKLRRQWRVCARHRSRQDLAQRLHGSVTIRPSRRPLAG